MRESSNKILGLTIFESALLSLSTFAISIGSSRWLSGEHLSSFYLGWAWMWGLVSVTSEWILTPSRLHDSKIVPVDSFDMHTRPTAPKLELEPISRFTFRISVALFLLHFISQAVHENIIFLTIAGLFAFQSFQSRRFYDVDSGRIFKSLRRSFALCFIQIAHIIVFPSALNNFFQNYLLLYVLSLIFLSWPQRITLPGLSLSEISVIILRGRYFAAGTLVRVMLFSSVLISVISFTRGGIAVNRIGVVQTMAGPALFIIGALCTGLIPILSRMKESGVEFRKFSYRTISFFALLGMVLACINFLFTDSLSHLLFGAGRLSGIGIEIQNLKFAVPIFILTVSIASSIGLTFQLFHMGKSQLLLQLLSGILAVLFVPFVGDYWIVSMPYFLMVMIFPVFNWKNLK